MKERRITRTVTCPKEQVIEKEIWGGTVKQRAKNWPLSVWTCLRCQHHETIKYYTDKADPVVVCYYDENKIVRTK